MPRDAAIAAQPPATQPGPLAVFEILVRENADSLTAFLRASVRDHAAAEDLFQDTMVIAWQKLAEYDRARPFGAWLRGIARNLVLAHYRTSARQTSAPPEQILDHLDRRLADIDRQPGDNFDEKLAALNDCLARLAPAYREPVDLHYVQKRSSDWIAEHLATTREAVQKRLQRARLQLAECLENKGVLARLEVAS